MMLLMTMWEMSQPNHAKTPPGRGGASQSTRAAWKGPLS
jgi:hypothetical protein